MRGRITRIVARPRPRSRTEFAACTSANVFHICRDVTCRLSFSDVNVAVTFIALKSDSHHSSSINWREMRSESEIPMSIYWSAVKAVALQVVARVSDA